MGKYLIGIDEGTTGCKTWVFDFDGALIASDYREYNVYFPQPNWVEQDGDEITEGLFSSCRAAIAKSGVDPKDIVALSLSTQGSTWGPTDEAGRLVRPFMGWQDTRSAYYVDDIKNGKYPATPERIYEISGYPLCVVGSLTKYLWVKDNEPELWAKTAHYSTHQDYFLNRFGADDWFVTDSASASRSMVYDVNNHCWNRELIDAFGLDYDKFPRVVPAGTVVGEIKPEIAAVTGLAVGTKLCVGAMDQNCSTMGAGLVQAGSAVAVIGTYGATYVVLDEGLRDPHGILLCKANSGPENFTFESASIASASSYRWFRNTFCQLEAAAGQVIGEDPYELINRQIATVEPGANGVTFLPYLCGAGLGYRNDPDARACFLNANISTTRAEICRSVMEGITYEMRDNMEAIARNGIDIKDLRITGGGSKAPLWCQMQADIYQKPVSVLQTSETGCLGAAIYAGIGAGVYESYEQAVERAVKIRDVYQPNPALKDAYDKGYRRFVAAYEGLANSGFFALNRE